MQLSTPILGTKSTFALCALSILALLHMFSSQPRGGSGVPGSQQEKPSSDESTLATSIPGYDRSSERKQNNEVVDSKTSPPSIPESNSLDTYSPASDPSSYKNQVWKTFGLFLADLSTRHPDDYIAAINLDFETAFRATVTGDQKSSPLYRLSFNSRKRALTSSPLPFPELYVGSKKLRFDISRPYVSAGCTSDTHWLKAVLQEKLSPRGKVKGRKDGGRPDGAASSSTSSPLLVMVDVGGNKGYTVANWIALMSTFGPSITTAGETHMEDRRDEEEESGVVAARLAAPFSSASLQLQRALVKKAPEQSSSLSMHCGMCCDCEDYIEVPYPMDWEKYNINDKKEIVAGGVSNSVDKSAVDRVETPPASSQLSASSAILFAFEPAPSNARHLMDFFSAKTLGAVDESSSGAETTLQDGVPTKAPRLAGRFDARSLLGAKTAGLTSLDGVLRRANTTASSPDVHLVIENMAVSSSGEQFVEFADKGEVGAENGKIIVAGDDTNNDGEKSSSSTRVKIRATTLSTYFEKFVQEDPEFHIDVLVTDTEGFDAEVFRSGEQLFKEQRVSVYQFEHWAKAFDTLQQILRLSTEYGYDCFFPLSRRIKIKGPVPRYLPVEDYINLYLRHGGADGGRTVLPFGLRMWGNSICVTQSTPLGRTVYSSIHKEMEKPSTTTVNRPSHNPSAKVCAGGDPHGAAKWVRSARMRSRSQLNRRKK